MTSEEFANAKQIHGWWRTVVDHPWFPYVMEEARRHRRFHDDMDFQPQHLEHKANGFRSGFSSHEAVIGGIGAPPPEPTEVPDEFDDFAQDAALTDHVGPRFDKQDTEEE